MPDTEWLKPGPKKPDLSWMKPATTQNSGSVVPIGGTVQNENQGDFDFLLKYNQNNAKLRAQFQPGFQQAYRTVGNAIANIGTGLVEAVGYLPELFDGDHDYSNALTRKMQEWHNPLGEVYRENPEQTWDWKDPAWWYNNVQQLTESAGAFALEGIGLAKIFGGIASGASKLMQAGKVGSQIGRAGAELATGATLAYTEGAMSGYRVYDQAYQNTYDRLRIQGMDEESAADEAAKTAGFAAATTVRMNTAMNTLLNVGGLAPIFKRATDEVRAFYKGAGARQAGESISAWKDRLTAATFDNPELKRALMARHGWSSQTAEMLKEGIEEVNTQYAEAEGNRIGNGQKGRSLYESLGDVEQYLDDVTNEEGALNFVLGAFGGMAQTLLVDHIPSQRILKYDADNNPILKKGADGKVEMVDGKPKYQTQLVTPKTANEFGTREYFDSIKKSIVKDIDYQMGLQKDLLAATAAGDQAAIEHTKNKMFAVGALDAISKGLGESWKGVFTEISQADNTTDLGEQMQDQIDQLKAQITEESKKEDKSQLAGLTQQLKEMIDQQESLKGVTPAMQKGLATSMTDNDFKKRAEDAAHDVGKLQEMHDIIQKKYVDDNMPVTGEIADHIFFRSANQYLSKRAIDKEEARIARIEEAAGFAELPEEGVLRREITKYKDHVDILNDVADRLNKDIADLKKADSAGDVKTIKSLIEKYRAAGVTEADLLDASKDLVRILELKVKQHKVSAEEARKNMELSMGFTSWAERNGGTFDDYISLAGERNLTKADRTNLEYLKQQHNVAEDALNKTLSVKGIENLTKALLDERKKLIKDINDKNQKDNIANFLADQNKKSAAKLNAKQKAAMHAQLETRIAELQKQLSTARAKKDEVDRQIKEMIGKGTGIFKNFKPLIKLRSESALLKNSIESLEAQINTLSGRLALVAVEKENAEIKAAVKTTENIKPDVVEKTIDENEDVDPEEFKTATEYAAQQQEEEKGFYDPTNDAVVTDFTAEQLSQTDPLGDYMALKEILPAEALPILDKLEAMFRKDGPSIQTTWDAFKRLVTMNKMTQEDVNLAFFTLRDYLEYEGKQPETTVIGADDPVTAETTESTKESVEEKEQKITETVTTDDIPAEIKDNQPEIIIREDLLFTDVALNNSVWEPSSKTHSGVKVNSSDLLYKTFNNEKKGILKMRNEHTPDGDPILDPKANHDRMIPGRISVGDNVMLRVDTEWDGTVVGNKPGEQIQDSFSDYTDGEGNLLQTDHAIANFPIKILHAKTGKMIGYFPRVDWVTMTQGALNYRNLTDLQAADAEGNREEGNVEIEAAKNMAIRRRLARSFTANKNTQLVSQVAARTGGQLMYQGTVDKDGKMKYKVRMAGKQLPDSTLEFGVAIKSGLFTGINQPYMKEITKTSEAFTKARYGAPVVFLPMPDGTFFASPLHTVKFSQRKGDINTVARAIELYLLNNTNQISEKEAQMIDKIKAATTFDIRNEDDLRMFIQQYYTHTSNFEDSQTMADYEAVQGRKTEKVQKFMLAIPQKGTGSKSPIKVGVKYSNMSPVYAQLKNGKLDPKFVQALTDGLSTRYKNVAFTDGKVRGVNDPRSITTVLIDKNDNVKTSTYHDYNEYLKTFTSTAIHGMTHVEGRYIYAANSQVLLDEDALLPSLESPTEIHTENPIDAGTVTDEEFVDPADAIDAFTNYSKKFNPIRKVISPEGPEMNLENLTDMYNFTPAEDRNGKTPAEVLTHLQSLGITNIADGYNPFVKCS